MFSGFSMWRRKIRLRRRSISASARRTSTALPTSRWENASPQSVSIFSRMRRHLGEVARVFGVDASAGGLGAVGKTEQQVADALEADHELHAGEKFARFGGPDFGDGGGHPVVDFHVERVEFAFALAKGVEQGVRAGGDAFGGGSRGFFRHVAGFDRAAHDVVVGGFGSGLLTAVLIAVSAGRECVRSGVLVGLSLVLRRFRDGIANASRIRVLVSFAVNML